MSGRIENTANFPGEAPTPQAATFSEVILYYFNETERRAEESAARLTDAELNVEPGHGAWSIGQLMKHQLDLLRMITETLQPGSTTDLDINAAGEAGNWKLDAILEERRALANRFRDVFSRAEAGVFFEQRPEMRPVHWKDWPVLMRMLRPLVDIATHVGQMNYARRQLGYPVGTRVR